MKQAHCHRITCMAILLMAFVQQMSGATDSVTVARPVMAAYTFEAGSARIADTYLSPLYYDGWHIGLNYQRYQAMAFNPERWTMSLTTGLSLDRAKNPARNAVAWDLTLVLDWGMMHRFRPVRNLTLAAGASTSLSLGALYNARNSNNPVSAKAAWTVNMTGYAAWNVNIGRLPVTLMYRPTLPVTGVFFSPAYSELYYEIYLGNRSGLAQPAWWGNYFLLDNLLTADLVFSATCLRIGYHGKIFSSKVNHLTTNIFTHAFVIGISGNWMSLDLRRDKPSPRSRKIAAIY